jgi:hypothetical protein
MFQKKKVNCIRIDGQTPVAARQTLVTDFQNKDDIKAAVVCVHSYNFLLFVFFYYSSRHVVHIPLSGHHHAAKISSMIFFV